MEIIGGMSSSALVRRGYGHNPFRKRSPEYNKKIKIPDYAIICVRLLYLHEKVTEKIYAEACNELGSPTVHFSKVVDKIPFELAAYDDYGVEGHYIACLRRDKLAKYC